MTQVLDRPRTITRPRTVTEQRVACGVVYLDAHEPGWEHKINLFFLNIADSYNCIMGQLHGNYYKVYDDDGDDRGYEHAVAHGFAACGRTGEDALCAITALNREWCRVIRERLDTHGE